MSDSVLTGGSTEYGTFAWEDGSTVPSVQNSGYPVIFTAIPETKKNYEEITDVKGNVVIRVERATPALNVTAATSGSENNRQAVFTVTAAKAGEGVYPTGTVTFTNSGDGSVIGTAALSEGTASFTWGNLLDQEYTVKAAYGGDNNYMGSDRELTFHAAKQNQQNFALVSIGAKTYGDSVALSTRGGNGSGGVRYESSDESVIRIENGRAVMVRPGTATITAVKAGDDDYNEISASETVTVGKRPLTVRADSKTVERGKPIPSFTYQAVGLVNGDTFTADPDMTAGVTNTNVPGKYAIVISGGMLQNGDNYRITYVNGTLHVVESLNTGGGTGGNTGNGSAGGSGGNAGDGGGSGGSGNGGDSGGGNSSGSGGSTNGLGGNGDGGSLGRYGKNGQGSGYGQNGGRTSGNGADASVQGEKQPFIKGEDGKIGWDVIRTEEENAAEGSTVNVDMNGSALVPGDIFDSIKGRDVTVTFDMGGGVLWSVHGESVTADRAEDVDFDLIRGENGVPEELLEDVAGGNDSVRLRLAHEGAFGFTAVLSIDLGGEYGGLYASLYYYNELGGALEWICRERISEDGRVSLAFSHASDYVIVIEGEQDAENGIEEVLGQENLDEGDKSDGTGDEELRSGQAGGLRSGVVIGVVVIAILVLAGVGGWFVVRKKRGGE